MNRMEMTPSQGSEWLVVYSRLKAAIVATRQKGLKAQQNVLNNFNNEILLLENQLNTHAASPMEYEISNAEIGRRQVIVANLKKSLNILNSQNMSMANSPVTANSVSPGTTPPNMKSVHRISAGYTPTTPAMSPVNNTTINPLSYTTDAGLVQRQQETIKIQDEILAQIGKGVDVLKDQAIAIGEETKVHIAIMDKLDDQVDVATLALEEETRHARAVQESSKTCYLYICILIEVVIILILLVLWFS